ncbi:hypothetical protein CEK25_012088 [Fusarium fujikuroi]|nr:hypothetical protein CEK25_012088 [Fusarium fujikuroi]
MERYAKVFMAPRKPGPGDKGVSIFLAGITTSTEEPDWREVLTNDLMNHQVTILNPDRPDWDSTWKEDFSDLQTSLYSYAPISLMELGLAVKSKSKRIIVCAQDGYRKKGNVEAVCRRFGAKFVNTGNELRDAIIATLEDGHK